MEGCIMKVAFFDTHPFEKKAFTEINRKYNFHIDFFEFKLDAHVAYVTEGYDAVCVFVNDVLDKETVKILSKNKCKLIVLRCSGYNNVDLESVENEDMTVLRVPSYSPHAITEHATALLLSLIRKIPQAYMRTRSGNFSIDGLMGQTLFGKTAGIIGTGKIGKTMAETLSGFGMQVLVNDVVQDFKWADYNRFDYVSLKEIFSKSDVISLHCPLTPDTRHIVNDKSMSLMKEKSILINTSRGALVDTAALVDALKNKKIGGAVLDVYEEESKYFFNDWSEDVIDDDLLIRLMTFPNVIVTSHQAFLTDEALAAIAMTTMENIYQYAKEDTLENIVMF